ncbi:MAG TPA: phytanoyl-CoA dioxygenase family protein [Verrucomicrobiae bacterium]|jgi:phytanoyl-CoA hydroxylase|nr:phytanoyl-CoA dioxygenase family protein [Verrucomicrobiae bacterium]
MIDAKDVAHYREHGYLVVPDVLDAATVDSLRREMEAILEGARAVTAHTDVYDLEPGHRPDAPRVRRVKTPHKFFDGFKRLYRDPELVSILQALLGPGVRLHGSKLNLKAPHYGSPVEWHQDWAFYPHTNDDVLAVGVMLNDATSDNGPLMVVPGSHRGPIFDHHVDGYFCGAVDPAAVEDEIAKAVPLTGRAGSMSFHHVRLLHGSAQNVSRLPRALLLYEYAATDAWPLMGVKDLAEFDARLVAGPPTLEPRVTPVPVRIPLPPARNQGSIYENQTAARRFFSFTEEAEAPSRT